MALKKEVVERLLLAKSLLAKVRFSSTADPDSKFLASQILTAHDAAELALAAICDERGVLPSKDKHYLMDYFEPLRSLHPQKEVFAKDYFRQLNRVRINIKHDGIFPDPRQWARVGESTWSYVSKWCADYLGIPLQDLDEATLLSSHEAKELYYQAQTAISKEDYKGALELLAKALFTVFRENDALRGLKVGQAKPEDAIRLSGFGVHGNDFLALQEFLPECDESSDTQLVIKWRQKRFGHPGNWRRNSANFCANTFLDVALKIQNASWIPGAIEYGALYEQQVTALKDGVEIWTHKTDPDATLLQRMSGTKTHREVVRTLTKGESLRARVTASKPSPTLIPSEASETPKTYVLSWDEQEEFIFGYVLAQEVKVTSVPRDSEAVRKYFPWLTETDWAAE